MKTLDLTTDERVLILYQKIEDYKRATIEIEADLRDDEPIDADLYQTFYSKALAIVYLLHDILGDNSSLSKEEKTELGAHIQREIIPIILQTDTTSRFYTKPLGYAGDYLVLEMIYNDRESGSTLLGRVVDRMHLDASTSKAVKNRRKLLADELLAAFENGNREPLSIMCISSGPAREIFDLLKNVGADASKIHATLIDFDTEALGFCEKWRNENGWQNQIDLVQETILNLIAGRSKVQIAPQDVVYSIGLIDYFQEKHVVKLLNYIHSILKPDGKVILGNFYKDNVFKEYMDSVLEWRLIHRDETDMNRMLQQSKFGKSGRIFFEGERMNMFVECVKN